MQQAATFAMAHETVSIHDKLQQAATGVTAAVAQQVTGIAVMQQAATITMAHETASMCDELQQAAGIVAMQQAATITMACGDATSCYYRNGT